ncbi:arginine--tRNA ligase [Blattabacterium cuenoti]|uniref:arginine--tRNA ligase n=1 Tax=Blattabacterium cuenoti TaxID=1653831 RepID=UPI001EEB3D36|nr:arginine--tRNA ligase [Blattabacterium cuenoti]
MNDDFLMNDDFQSVEKLTKQGIFILYGSKKYCNKLYFQYSLKQSFGDISIILYPLSKILKSSVATIGNNIGNYVKKELKGKVNFSVVQGFLNFFLGDNYYFLLLKQMLNYKFYDVKISSKTIMVEYSSPNTNKPLHIGHIRNSLIGESISKILKTVGYNVKKVQIINDRGIHISKSMAAWIKFGNNQTPKKMKMKGDHFVGTYYRLFEKINGENGITTYFKDNKTNESNDDMMKLARSLLIKWEYGDDKIMKIWKMMNGWVYDGFKETYKKLGIHFDHIEYESKIYNFGKKIVQEGVKNGVFVKQQDGSIWIDLTKDGFDKKLLLRADQTSVYITQDIGTAINRFKIYNLDKLIYIVGKEQEYHFQVLFKILKKLGYKWVNKLIHLSYEMVVLPEGKMKSRIGNVIEADKFISEMIFFSKTSYLKRKNSKIMNEQDQIKYFEVLGLGAIKYYFLQIDPKKQIIFHPEKSIDFKGKTALYIQYTYSRIRSIEKKFFDYCLLIKYENLLNVKFDIYEKNMIKIMYQYPVILKKSATELNPSILANYVYHVSKIFNNFYQKKKILNPSNIPYSNMCINIIHVAGNILKYIMNLLGIQVIDYI